MPSPRGNAEGNAASTLARLCRLPLVLLLAVPLASCSNRAAPTAPTPVSPRPVRDLNDYPAWSRDGTRLLYEHPAQNQSEVPLGTNQIWLYDFTSGSRRYLCYGFDAQWMAQDSAFTFFDGVSVIYRYSMATGTIAVEVGCAGQSLNAKTSPDGHYLAFGSSCGVGSEVVYVSIMNLETMTRRSLNPNGKGGSWRGPAWSPDGSHLAHLRRDTGTGRLELFVMDTTGMAPFRVHTAPYCVDQNPRWSADGNWIYFTRTGEQDIATEGIWRVHPDGTGLAMLVHFGYHADISPRDTALAFRKYDAPTNSYDIWISALDGTGSRRLFADPGIDSSASRFGGNTPERNATYGSQQPRLSTEPRDDAVLR